MCSLLEILSSKLKIMKSRSEVKQRTMYCRKLSPVHLISASSKNDFGQLCGSSEGGVENIELNGFVF